MGFQSHFFPLSHCHCPLEPQRKQQNTRGEEETKPMSRASGWRDKLREGRQLRGGSTALGVPGPARSLGACGARGGLLLGSPKRGPPSRMRYPVGCRHTGPIPFKSKSPSVASTPSPGRIHCRPFGHKCHRPERARPAELASAGRGSGERRWNKRSLSSRPRIRMLRAEVEDVSLK